MATIPKEVLEQLGDIVKQFHTALKKGGAEGIKSELESPKWNNFFEMGTILSKWDNILYKLDNVANKLKKGNPEQIIDAVTDLSKSIADLQRIILGFVAEVGSFIPGPIGIVCSLALAIGCFAVGDVPGGFLNLLGAIPGAKFAKFLPISALKRSVSKFQTLLVTRWNYRVASLTTRAVKRHCENFRLKEDFHVYFSNELKSIITKLSKIGEKIGKKIENTKEQLLNKIDDGWGRAREELEAERAFDYMLKSFTSN